MDGLGGGHVARGALRLRPAADAQGTLHAEQVVAAGHQRGHHLALQAHHALPGALAVPVRAAGVGGRARGGRDAAGQ